MYFKISAPGFTLYYAAESKEKADSKFNEDVGPFPEGSYEIVEISESDLPEHESYRR